MCAARPGPIVIEEVALIKIIGMHLDCMVMVQYSVMG